MKSPSFQFYPSDWLSSRAVRLMDAEQRGWYIQLLAEAWESEPQATLPNDEPLLKVLAGINSSSTDVEQRWVLVRSQFKKRGAVIYNERQMEEVVRQEVNRQKKSEAGKASAEARRIEREAIKAQHLRQNERSNKRSTPVEIRSASVPTEEVTESNLPIASSVSITTSTSIPEEKKEDTSRAALARDVFAFWRTHLNHPNAIFDGKRGAAIIGRLKEGYTADQLKEAIRGCLLSDFHMGREPGKPAIHDGVRLICQDAEHVDKFIAIAQSGGSNGNGTNATNQSRGYQTAAERRANGFRERLAVVEELRPESVRAVDEDVRGQSRIAGR